MSDIFMARVNTSVAWNDGDGGRIVSYAHGNVHAVVKQLTRQFGPSSESVDYPQRSTAAVAPHYFSLDVVKVIVCAYNVYYQRFKTFFQVVHMLFAVVAKIIEDNGRVRVDFLAFFFLAVENTQGVFVKPFPARFAHIVDMVFVIFFQRFVVFLQALSVSSISMSL